MWLDALEAVVQVDAFVVLLHVLSLSLRPR